MDWSHQLTHLSLLDARIDGVKKVCPVLVTLGQLSEFFPQELPFVVAHHPLEGWVDILLGEGRRAHVSIHKDTWWDTGAPSKRFPG